jgi:hypothetical protein
MAIGRRLDGQGNRAMCCRCELIRTFNSLSANKFARTACVWYKNQKIIGLSNIARLPCLDGRSILTFVGCLAWL